MKPRVFVVMPFGIKEGINFNEVYKTLIQAAFPDTEYDVVRADTFIEAGDIRTDMFQELLLSDLVVADLTIDNPNVWYELGVRHALRANGAVLLSARSKPMPFDLYTDRKMRYTIKDSVPDPDFVSSEKDKLAEMVKASMTAWHGKKASPVYNLLPFLKQPDWKSLRVGWGNEMWEKQSQWLQRIEVARRNGRSGDILVLTQGAPIQALLLDAYRFAAKALRESGAFGFALEQIEKALAIDPTDLESRQEKGMLLGRLHRFEEAREWLRAVAQGDPHNAETCALLGRVEKDQWSNTWRVLEDPERKLRTAADNIQLLMEAANTYVSGFRQDPSHYYSGINAVTLLHLASHLSGKEEPDQQRARTSMEGGVRWVAYAAATSESVHKKNFWARITLAELSLLLDEVQEVERAYEHALAAADQNWFALNSSLQQLQILSELGFRIPQVKAATEEVRYALSRLTPPWRPRHVYLFSGHMIDAPGRESERFPPDLESDVASAIAAKLDEMGAGEGDLAMCQGACGGDLLFAHAALARGMRLNMYLPFEEPAFLQKSVAFAGEIWCERFYAAKQHANSLVRVMPIELGPTPAGVNPFERANLWLLYSALAWEPSEVRFIAFWDGKSSGKPGGTKHMIEEVRKRLGRIYKIDANELLYRKRR